MIERIGRVWAWLDALVFGATILGVGFALTVAISPFGWRTRFQYRWQKDEDNPNGYTIAMGPISASIQW